MLPLAAQPISDETLIKSLSLRAAETFGTMNGYAVRRSRAQLVKIIVINEVEQPRVDHQVLASFRTSAGD